MKVSVIGSGAIGKTYGGLLALAGHNVHFLVRNEFSAIREAGHFSLYFQEFDQTLEVKNPNLYIQAELLPPSDMVIISLKTTENNKLSSLLSHCLKESSVVLVIQNGIGNEEKICQLTGTRPLICGIATIGAVRSLATQIHIKFLGNLKFAPFLPQYTSNCKTILDIFSRLPIALPISLHDNYKEIRWCKLVWNIPMGAFSLIFDQSTHALVEKEPYLSLIKSLIEEIRTIADAEGIIITDNFVDNLITFTQKSGPYFPTFYQDFKQGKALEKEYLFDNVLAIANQHKLYPPLLTLIEKQLSIFLEIREKKAKLPIQ